MTYLPDPRRLAQILELKAAKMTHSQIAVALGLTVSQVKNMLYRNKIADREYMSSFPLGGMTFNVWHAVAFKARYGYWRPLPGAVLEYDAIHPARDAGLIVTTTRVSGKPGAPDREVELLARLTPLALDFRFGASVRGVAPSAGK